jgi:hypothetical protein
MTFVAISGYDKKKHDLFFVDTAGKPHKPCGPTKEKKIAESKFEESRENSTLMQQG